MQRNTVLSVIVAITGTVQLADAQNSASSDNAAQFPDAREVTPDPWPKTAQADGATYTLYQPQLDSWDGYNLDAHAAVSVVIKEGKDPVFGVVNITAKTDVDLLSRTVELYDIAFEKASFPSAPDQATLYQKGLQDVATKEARASVPLDQLQAALTILQAEKKAKLVPVKNDPPAFVFSTTPAILVLIDGDPVWKPIQNKHLERILNTRSLILRDGAGKLYLHLFDGFLEAKQLSGPWTVASTVSDDMKLVAKQLNEWGAVDLMEGPTDETTQKKPSLANCFSGSTDMKANAVPKIVIATRATELVVTEGEADWTPLDGTHLLYIKNTTANVFRSIEDQHIYILVAGRWFSTSKTEGPWKYIEGRDLPPDFARIPDESVKENVKASVPNTAQAQEALISNEIPQTAHIDRHKAQLSPTIDGPPQLKPIADTPLFYVVNSPVPIIKVDDRSWFACENGVWFKAAAATGPWVVATSVPAVIYSIPASSPLHYVTYVRIYRTTPEVVVVGYTPGYYGTVVTADGVVVYGTGYVYEPYIGAAIWYPRPVTYGFAVNVAWTPWTGWVYGYGFGWGFGAVTVGHGVGWAWGVAPYWGPARYRYAAGPHGAVAWGPDGWAATSGNVYHHWGSTAAVTRTSAGFNAWTGNAWSSKVGHSYNSTTGRISAGQRGAVENVYTGNYAYGGRGVSYNTRTGAEVSGGRVTVGNENTGRQATVGHAEVTGRAGQTTHVQGINDRYYAERNGNVYRNTGDGWQHYDNGNWNEVRDNQRVNSLQSQERSRQVGQQRAAGSTWSGNWSNFSGSHTAAGRSWGGGNFSGGRGGNFGGFRGGAGRR